MKNDAKLLVDSVFYDDVFDFSKIPKPVGQKKVKKKPEECIANVKSRFFKNRELYGSNLPQNSNCGWELVQKSGVQIPDEKGQNFLSCFLFIFIFSIKYSFFG